jgi:hypothetical protein
MNQFSKTQLNAIGSIYEWAPFQYISLMLSHVIVQIVNASVFSSKHYPS